MFLVVSCPHLCQFVRNVVICEYPPKSVAQMIVTKSLTNCPPWPAKCSTEILKKHYVLITAMVVFLVDHLSAILRALIPIQSVTLHQYKPREVVVTVLCQARMKVKAISRVAADDPAVQDSLASGPPVVRRHETNPQTSASKHQCIP